ncbi:hypothetical protein ACFLWM_01870 [Chloroflexota bacterium]
MILEMPYLDIPETGDAKIWRYIDFTKFVSLLDRRALFFTRADKLGDSFEGSHSEANIKKRPELFKNTLEEFGKYSDDDLMKTLSNFSSYCQFLHKITAINCWHLSDIESDAMWKIYAERDRGIAIQSTHGRLKDSLEYEDFGIYINKVKYIDYVDDFMVGELGVGPFYHKRKEFSHENELRAIIQKLPGLGKPAKVDFKPIRHNGIYVKVDLNLLVETVYLSPACQLWFQKLVKSVTARYGLNKPIVVSKLVSKPKY